jgi:GNAT superfamily N-acetyltransferase
MKTTIRRATKEDLSAIRAWLEEEDRLGVHGNFLCNWNVIERAYKEKSLQVMIDRTAEPPRLVAFQLGGLLQSGILQVRDNLRGSGLGRRFVEHCIRQALQKDECLLSIQCAPETSIPFWQRMGFTTYEEAGATYGYRILDKTLPLPAGARLVDVTIRFFAEERKWNPSTPPLTEVRPAAVQTSDGVTHLAQRVLFHQDVHRHIRDIVVELEIKGKAVYLDKMKYERAAAFGVHRCRNGWYIDQIQVAHVLQQPGQ